MSQDPGMTLINLMFGYIQTGALACAAKLKIADKLEAGPKSIELLAKEAATRLMPRTSLMMRLETRLSSA